MRFFLILFLLSSIASARTPGKKLFRKHCTACHEMQREGYFGPRLCEVYGSKVATRSKTFDYTKELKESKIVWNRKTLDRWLQGPPKMVPGTGMVFVLEDEKERKEVIDFLETLKCRKSRRSRNSP